MNWGNTPNFQKNRWNFDGNNFFLFSNCPKLSITHFLHVPIYVTKLLFVLKKNLGFTRITFWLSKTEKYRLTGEFIIHISAFHLNSSNNRSSIIIVAKNHQNKPFYTLRLECMFSFDSPDFSRLLSAVHQSVPTPTPTTTLIIVPIRKFRKFSTFFNESCPPTTNSCSTLSVRRTTKSRSTQCGSSVSRQSRSTMCSKCSTFPVCVVGNTSRVKVFLIVWSAGPSTCDIQRLKCFPLLIPKV